MLEISKPLITKRWVAKSINVLHYGVNEPDQVTTTGLPTFIYFDDEQGLLAELEKDIAKIPTLPVPGTHISKGEVYQFASKLYEVRQTHIRTEHDPSTVPALFIMVRPAGTSLEWMIGEKVFTGDWRLYSGQTYEAIQSHITQADWIPPNVPALWKTVTAVTDGVWAPRESVTIGLERTYLGKIYICLQTHITQLGWEPTITLGVLWSEKATSTAWGPGQAVNINDVRTYQGLSYKCRQAHTTQIGWEPPSVPALWLKI